MILDTMHPEDVKAAIRKKYGSVQEFVRIHDLPVTGVSDIFRGRTSEPVRKAIEKFLSEQDSESILLDHNSLDATAHGLNAEGQ